MCAGAGACWCDVHGAAHRCIMDSASTGPDAREAGTREGEGKGKEGGEVRCMHARMDCMYALAGGRKEECTGEEGKYAS